MGEIAVILFLDDNPQRAVLAYNRMSVTDREHTIWCMTAKEAIQTVWDYRNNLTKVSLDHDLGGQQYVNTKREDCGMEVVRFLENKARKEPEEFKKLEGTLFIIHSWNSHAAPIMRERLSTLGLNSVWIPFGSGL